MHPQEINNKQKLALSNSCRTGSTPNKLTCAKGSNSGGISK